MKSVTKGLLVAVGVSVAVFLNAQPATAEQTLPPLSSERIAQIVSSSDRTAADRTNDEPRKPEQMLRFIGIRPGIVAVNISAAGGYTTVSIASLAGNRDPGASPPTKYPTA
jgi:predicted methyltransferase